MRTLESDHAFDAGYTEGVNERRTFASISAAHTVRQALPSSDYADSVGTRLPRTPRL